MSKPPVILIGPDRNHVGGMSSVVAQMRLPVFADRYQLEYSPPTFSANARESLISRVSRHARQIRRLRSLVRRSDQPIVHIHTCSGFSFYRSVVDMVFAKRSGASVVLHVHGAKFDEFHAGEPAWRRRIIAWSLAQADTVIALSAGWSRVLGRISPRSRLAVVENAVEIPTSLPHTREDGPCRLLLLARMDTWKGVDDLLAACRRLTRERVPFELTLAGPPGSAGDRASLDEKIHALSLKNIVRYVGTVEGQAKAELLGQTDIYVQPSHHEGLPLSLLEALSYGLPVVATQVGAVGEVLEEGEQGLLVQPHRPAMLADSLKALILDIDRRRKMADAARELALQRFSLERFHQDLHALYGEMIGSRNPVGQRSSGVSTRNPAPQLRTDGAG